MSINSEQFRQALFGSAAWVDAWRAAWGEASNLQPVPKHGIYRAASKIKRVLPFTIAAPLGISTPPIPSIRSEYFFFARNPADSQRAIAEFIADAQHKKWDQLWLPDIPVNSNELPLLKAAAKDQGWDLIEQDTSTAYSINTASGDFTNYLQQLGKNSRLQLFNRRKNLEKLGEVSVRNCWPNLPYFLEITNTFHQQRWQKPLYSARNKHFIEQLLPALAAAGHVIDLSLLCVDEKPVATVLDLHINGRVYNLQSGFSETLDAKISLGTLHFGYKIEAAFQSPQLSHYDFMAGHGRSSNYKQQFSTDALELITFTLVRSGWLKLLYRGYKRIYQPCRARWKKILAQPTKEYCE